jgi:hypothetical protein
MQVRRAGEAGIMRPGDEQKRPRVLKDGRRVYGLRYVRGRGGWRRLDYFEAGEIQIQLLKELYTEEFVQMLSYRKSPFMQLLRTTQPKLATEYADPFIGPSVREMLDGWTAETREVIHGFNCTCEVNDDLSCVRAQPKVSPGDTVFVGGNAWTVGEPIKGKQS